ncbi:hypothetical protein IVA96_30375 [Bradyrhizobium sp. 159]|uniref:hypothetical protein n=1 Tax=Bradyrhizobium sp. 159 TaxID=2782632 RepID=UPI001FF739C4|nr:hypothetical protein [Bradyrhizobium sp. 159]MCK1620802.1 hypothetical protein [Bradyrhizobium sp. 159]
MEAKASPSKKGLRRIFKERPALKAARDLLLKIEEVAEWASHEDWALDEFEQRMILRPAMFWEYARIAGEDFIEFGNRLRRAIETFNVILAAMPNEQANSFRPPSPTIADA